MPTSVRFVDGHGDVVEVPKVSATDAKNAFGRVLETVARTGCVAITRHDEPKAVLLSIEAYEALTSAQRNALQTLTEGFDEVLARMQAPRAADALQAAFDTPPHALGAVAVQGGRRR